MASGQQLMYSERKQRLECRPVNFQMLEFQDIFCLKSGASYLPRLPELLTVIRREWLVQKRQLRTRRRLLLRIAFILMFFVWQIMGMIGHQFVSYLHDTLLIQDLGYYLFFALALAQILPAICESIAWERETGSLDMLLLTPLRSSEILGGKLIAACLPVLTMILLITLIKTLILLAFGFFIISEDLLTLLVEVWFCGLIALFCTTVFNSSARALGVTMGILAGAFLLPMILTLPVEFLQTLWSSYLLRPATYLGLLFPAIITAAGTTALVGKGTTRLAGKALRSLTQILLLLLFTAGYLILFILIWNHQQPFRYHLYTFFGPADYRLIFEHGMGSSWGPEDPYPYWRLLWKFFLVNVVGTATLFSFSVERLELLRRR